MGKTFANGVINGRAASQDFSFLVDTGATWLTLPPQAITRLELVVIPDQIAVITTPSDVLHLPLYRASGTLAGVAFDTRLVPAHRPRVGYELLQRLGFVVDLVTERIALRTEWRSSPPSTRYSPRYQPEGSIMVDTYIRGSVIGKSETREFDFQVLKHSAQLGLPQSAIDVLGLAEVPGLLYGPMADGAANRAPTYLARIDFGERSIHQYVTPVSEPTIGADALRALGYKVDLEQGAIAKPAKPLKIQRGLMPTMLDVSDLLVRELMS